MAYDPIRVGQITNADVYLEDNRLIGRIKEFEIPEFSYKTVTHEALGMIGALELPGRGVEALKGKVVFDYIDTELDHLMINPTRVHKWTMRTRVDVFDSNGLNEAKTYRRALTVRAMFTKSGALGLKLGENVEREIDIAVVAMTDTVSNLSVPLLEYDVFNGILNINGTPVWPD